jgi:hypothetical protein
MAPGHPFTDNKNTATTTNPKNLFISIPPRCLRFANGYRLPP